jgi:hypothetical protein
MHAAVQGPITSRRPASTWASFSPGRVPMASRMRRLSTENPLYF